MCASNTVTMWPVANQKYPNLKDSRSSSWCRWCQVVTDPIDLRRLREDMRAFQHFSKSPTLSRAGNPFDRFGS